MANDAISTNPNASDISINTHGSDFLWAVFALMLFVDIIFMVWSWTLPKGRRTFHHLAEFILTTAAIAYFTMASNLGSTPVEVEFTYAGNGTRAIWYARYIDWVITTPALLLELLLGTGLPLSDIMTCLFFDLVMIITGLVGALVVSSYKWGYFAFGTAALFYIWYILLGPAMISTTALGPEFRRSYMLSAIYLSVIWALYPVAWGLADGANVIGSDGEMIFYGVLDVIAKPIFCLFHVWSLRNIDYNKLQLQSGKYSTGAHYEPAHDAEMNNMHKNRLADTTAAHPRASEATAVAR